MKKLNNMTIVVLAGITLLFSCQPSVKKELMLNPLFSNHMVLQEQEEVAFWGEYSAEKEVSVKASWGAEQTVSSDKEGTWNLTLSTPEAGGPHEITIETRDSTITLVDVMVGEVWLASGQSNMEMSLSGYMPLEPIDNYKEEIENAKYPEIRTFNVLKEISSSKKENVIGEWLVCSPETAGDYSATGYFFARKIHKELNVPVGIIHASWGGTEAEAWISKEGLNEFPEMLREIESFDEEFIETWVKQFDQIPVSFSMEDFEKLDLGDSEILRNDFDDTEWPKVTVPHENCLSTEFIPDVESSFSLNGVFWYRNKFNIKNVSSDYVLYMGAIDDGDITYINGHKVGSMWIWNENRIYTVPSDIMKEGENTIVIKQFDGGGGSSVKGPMFLENENGESINIEGEWRALFYGDIRGRSIIKYGFEFQDQLKKRPELVNMAGPNELASSLYNGMIHPLIPYTLKGAIWYQGESNVGRAKQYQKLFPAMINDWREQWNHEFPFYFVQIAPFFHGNELSPALRDAQRRSLITSNTGMAVTMDIGDSISIHPGNKQDVGDRLARLALANDYGADIVASGPLYKSHTVSGNKIILEFDFSGGGLKTVESGLSGFEVAGDDRVYVPAIAKILEEKIEVFATTVSEPKYVRYAWRDYIVGTLFNKEGLPGSPFTSED